jgi:4-oxalocrotonate tautomerase
MPFVEVKLAGKIDKNQKKEIVRGITKILEDVAGKPPQATYIVIQEVERENWSKGGELLDK